MSYVRALDRIFGLGTKIAMDRASVRRVDQDGHLHVAASVVSAGEIDSYVGGEIPGFKDLGLNQWGTYQVFRDPVELERAVPTFSGKPLLSRHRPLMADDHPKGVVIGSVMNPIWKYPYVIAELVVWDAVAIGAITSGETAALSAGYRYTPVRENGTWNGKSYQIRMKDLFCNHVALVSDGRVSAAMVGDARPARQRRAAA